MPAANGKRRSSLPGFYGRPLKRLKEIECLAHWRHRTKAYTDPVRALAVAGHALAALEGMRLRDTTRHPGLQFSTAANFLDRCDLDLTERDIGEIVASVCQARCGERPFVMTDVEAGKLLDLTRDERTNLDIRTIEAMDEAPADRAVRMAEWKRTNDRLRRRRATDRKRAEKGLPPIDRDSPKVATVKPWEALGMPKSTYLRRKAKGTLGSETTVSRTYASEPSETDVSQTYRCESETGVSRSFRRNIEVVRHVGLTTSDSSMWTVAPSLAPLAYGLGLSFDIVAPATNTSTTVNANVSSLGNKRIKKADGSDPAIGDLIGGVVYPTVYDGTNIRIKVPLPSDMSPSTTTLISTALSSFVIIADQKSAGTSGGTFTAGAYRTRDLNTILADPASLVGGAVTLSANRVTLGAGSWLIEGSAPATGVNVHKCRLYNITAGAVAAEGSTENTLGPSAADFVQTTSTVTARLTLASPTQFELQHNCSSTYAFGFGEASGGVLTPAAAEIYSILRVTKLG